MHGKICGTGSVEDGGIGIKIEAPIEAGGDGVVRVDDVIASGPAAKSGKVAVDDAILDVGGRSTVGRSVEEVRTLIVGPVGTPVTITARKESGERYIVTLIRSGGGHEGLSVEERSEEGCGRAIQLHEHVKELEGSLASAEKEIDGMSREIEVGLHPCALDVAKLYGWFVVWYVPFAARCQGGMVIACWLLLVPSELLPFWTRPLSDNMLRYLGVHVVIRLLFSCLLFSF